MTSIQVDDETAKRLAEMASDHHMTLAELLQSLAVRSMTTQDRSNLNLDAALEPLLFDGPMLQADFSRADIYADHD